MYRSRNYAPSQLASRPHTTSTHLSVEPPEDVRALGEQLPPSLYLGTSSWTFPGWKGLVYDREATPARHMFPSARARAVSWDVLSSSGEDPGWCGAPPRAR